MTYQEFKQEIEKNIKTYLPEEYQAATICINEIPKNNGIVKSAISFKPPEDNIARQIYLDGAYEEYCENSSSMENILKKAAQFIINAMENTVVFDPAMVLDYQQVQDKVMLRVVNKESNQDLLQSIPYREIDGTDLIATFRIDVSVGDSDGSILVNHDMLKNWDVTENDLYETSLQNTKTQYPFTLQSMEKIFSEIMFGIPATAEPNKLPSQLEPYMQYVLANESKINGAACILYPDLLKEIGEKFESNFFILPSSIHEIILMKDTGEMSAAELQRMVIDVNATQVEPQEVLSNQVYSYNYKENSLSMETTKEETNKLMAQISNTFGEVCSSEMQSDMERE